MTILNISDRESALQVEIDELRAALAQRTVERNMATEALTADDKDDLTLAYMVGHANGKRQAAVDRVPAGTFMETHKNGEPCFVQVADDETGNAFFPLYRAACAQDTTFKWLPIETAPKDNKRPLMIARFNGDGTLQRFDWDASWEREQESWEISEYYWILASANGNVEEPSHWMYQPKGFDNLNTVSVSGSKT